MAYTYILKSLLDNKKYIGSTINLERRLAQHNNGYVKSTKHRRPLVLLAYQESTTVQEAAILEKKYKNSHGYLERAFKSGKFIQINGV